MKVLLAEDDPLVRRLLQRYLEGWDHEVFLATNGAEAWELFQREECAIVVTDWMMPHMDGLELIRRVRASNKARYVYVVVLTARADTQDLVEAMEAGADDFVVKPFAREELRVRLCGGERIVRLEQSLLEQNRELARARAELEQRVVDRTTELELANEALRAEVIERRRAASELEAVQQRLLEGEAERKRFYRDVLRAVTHDKLRLAEPSDIAAEGCLALELSLDEPAAYSTLRGRLRKVGREAGLTEDAAEDLVLAAGEAATNAIKHASGIRCAVYLSDARITVRVSDHGQGMRTEDLPASVLTAGFSTKISLGMGYTLMLSLVDRIWLATGREGTIVQIEKLLAPSDEFDLSLLAAWDRI